MARSLPALQRGGNGLIGGVIGAALFHPAPGCPIFAAKPCPPRGAPKGKVQPMSRYAMQRLSFFLLMGVTIYASLGLG